METEIPKTQNPIKATISKGTVKIFSFPVSSTFTKGRRSAAIATAARRVTNTITKSPFV